jgi:hypothetical protein
MKHASIVLFAFICASSAASSQSILGPIRGTVLDQNGQPVPHAYIVERSSGKFAIGNTIGEFSLLPSGSSSDFRISVRRIGFFPLDTIISPDAGSARLQLRLFPVPVELATVRVEGRARGYDEYLDRNGFYRRMQKAPDGSFITAEQIEKRNPNAITHMLEDLAGVRVLQTNGLRGKQHFGNVPLGRGGLCNLGLVLDGQRVEYKAPPTKLLQPGMTSLSTGSLFRPHSNSTGTGVEPDNTMANDTFDELIPPSMVGGMEIYLSAASVPVELQRFVKSCGLVVVWTRYQ